MNSNLLGKSLDSDLLVPLRYYTKELLDKSLRVSLLEPLGIQSGSCYRGHYRSRSFTLSIVVFGQISFEKV